MSKFKEGDRAIYLGKKISEVMQRGTIVEIEILEKKYAWVRDTGEVKYLWCVSLDELIELDEMNKLLYT